jgi:hypothetical protein
VITVGDPFQHEAVAESPGEAHRTRAPGTASAVLALEDRVVERPVQVTERHIHGDPGDRQLGLRHTR